MVGLSFHRSTKILHDWASDWVATRPISQCKTRLAGLYRRTHTPSRVGDERMAWTVEERNWTYHRFCSPFAFSQEDRATLSIYPSPCVQSECAIPLTTYHPSPSATTSPCWLAYWQHSPSLSIHQPTTHCPLRFYDDVAITWGPKLKGNVWLQEVINYRVV